MNSRNARFDPRKVLDSDWRKQIWKRWLRSTLADAAGADAADAIGHSDRQANIASGTARAVENDVAELGAPKPPTPVAEAVPGPAAARPGLVGVEPEREHAARRNELRARFDALFDRVASIDDTLDALGKRFTLNSAHARRQEQRVCERIESSAEMLERQTLALEAIQTQIERLDLRLARLEGRTRRAEHESGWSECRDAGASSQAAVDDSDFSDLELAFAEESRSAARLVAPDPSEPPPLSGSSIHGDLSEMSLPTVLAMLELERRTGLLKVRSEEGQVVTATLRTGSVVGAKRRELDADPVDVLREALRFTKGHFWFRQSEVELVSGPPRSVGSVLLEASSRNDEAARTG